MKVDEGKYSVLELVDWYKRKELVPNKEYQRGAGLWPTSAKSYFIDTILKEFPFPKLYFHERLDMTTRRPRREIVDGQQRMSTIAEFVSNQFELGSNAEGLKGKRFDDLSSEQQEKFYSYAVSVDVIRNADRSEILSMFRRMNAYTLPLNGPEKRHSEFFGEFKDWVNTVLDRYGRLLVDWNVFTSRQIVRMADAEFIADVALAVEEGVVSTSPTKLRKLYKRYDTSFSPRTQIDERITSVLDVIRADLSELQGTFLTRPHVFHSLICALLHRRYGLPNAEELIGYEPVGSFFADRRTALAALMQLATAYEEKSFNGPLGNFVRSTSEGGNRAAQRAERLLYLCHALDGDLSAFG
ncbi:hypothetical protein CO669_02610 [Bradyrhizobium sp. Y36]|uniref:DUF262 domain-containing protein n=1 Tax=Bradyrhizobium sp. Y36 TaxID=2035447 RepID=UPI000BE7D039|nr:DUF262 domain-containing protein [Bradyrhizobium sp. Y36]PDT92171.1 hypothetical protein CO669_02610 [Bradyrhizobium sp. Y36]